MLVVGSLCGFEVLVDVGRPDDFLDGDLICWSERDSKGRRSIIISPFALRDPAFTCCWLAVLVQREGFHFSMDLIESIVEKACYWVDLVEHGT